MSFLRLLSPSRPGLRILCNVAAGCSFGGVALLAEERRRRILLAQRILDNARVLQSYKTYQTAAPIMAFEVDGAADDDSLWFASDRPPQTRSHSHIQRHDETRRHGDIQRHEQTGPHEDTKSHQHSPSDPQRTDTEHQYEQMSRRDWQSRRRKIRTIPTHLQSLEPSVSLDDWGSRFQLSKASRLEMNERREALTAKRIEDCLATGTRTSARHARTELSAFLATVDSNHSLGARMKAAADVLNQAQTLKRRRQSTPTLPILEMPASTTNARNSDSIQASDLARTIRELLEASKPSDAYQTLLLYSSSIHDTISTELQRAITELIVSFKSLGAFAVVKDIIEVCSSALKGFRVVAADLFWLLEREVPAHAAVVAIALSQPLLATLPLEESLSFRIRVTDFFLERARPSDAISVFTKLFSSSDLASSDALNLASSLLQHTVQHHDRHDLFSILTWASHHHFDLLHSGVSHKALRAAVKKAKLPSSLLSTIPLVAPPPADSTKPLQQQNAVLSEVAKLQAQPHALFEYVSSHAIDFRRHFSSASSSRHQKLAFKLLHLYSHKGSPSMARQLLESTADFEFQERDPETVKDCHETLLRRYWSSTADLAATVSLFETINATAAAQRYSMKPYGVIIKTCIEAGEFTKAEEFVNMKRSDLRQRAVDIETLSHSMLALGLQHDWPAVDRMLEEAAEKDLLAGQPASQRDSMLQLVQTYCTQHSTSDSLAFVLRLYNDLGMASSPAINSSILQLVLKERDVESFDAWCEFLKSTGQEAPLLEQAAMDPVQIAASDGSLQRRLKQLSQHKQHRQVVEEYTRSLAAGSASSAACLAYAVEASLVDAGTSDEADSLISQGEALGINTARARAVLQGHALRRQHLSFEDAFRTAREAYAKTAVAGHHAALAIARSYLDRSEPRAGLRFMTAVHTATWAPAPDGPWYTMFARLAVRARQPDLLRWVLSQLQTNVKRLDGRLVATLRHESKDVRRTLRHALFTDRRVLLELLEVLEDGRLLIIEARAKQRLAARRFASHLVESGVIATKPTAVADGAVADGAVAEGAVVADSVFEDAVVADSVVANSVEQDTVKEPIYVTV